MALEGSRKLPGRGNRTQPGEDFPVWRGVFRAGEVLEAVESLDLTPGLDRALRSEGRCVCRHRWVTSRLWARRLRGWDPNLPAVQASLSDFPEEGPRFSFRKTAPLWKMEWKRAGPG